MSRSGAPKSRVHDGKSESSGRVDDWCRAMQRALASSRDPAYAESLRRSLGPGVRLLGVRVPAIRSAVRDALSGSQRPGPEELVELMDRCAAGQVREEMLFGTFMLARHAKRLTVSQLPRIDAWIDAVDNWETCDQLATGVVAVVIAQDKASMSCLPAWAAAKNRWRRRFAAVTAAGLNQKGRRFPSEALAVCARLLNDADPVVRKAVAWAIREVALVDAGAAQRFVREYARSMHPSVRKEAMV